ncbi:hypothetical protein [Flavobacterium sp. GT3P67]|uniref:hypothetical protein n=1 Tax=Flavobacterium sp. GT3P67 TaxID=2541722 RepID=UPI00104B7F5E|nr:hypothetical protein [Flavobacterium sp. GT3P67]TDE52668.1 hypothetical protein E0H99_11115 [Flavobacterium sp. GT3P67]
MKKILVLLTTVLLLVGQFIYAQNKTENAILSMDKKPFYLESGLNLSLPVHIEMYRSHRLAVGVNVRAGKIISRKLELGIRFDYDYRFIKKNSRILTPESTLEERALHSNFSLFSIKPNVQFNLNSNWYWGVETGVGYALSDEDGKIGLGFVSEYASDQQFGLCSGLYFGKSFIIGAKKTKVNLSMDLTQFLAHGHAENSLGLRINYRFLN